MEFIRLNYLYRDYSNYKKHNSVIFSNPNRLSIDAIETELRKHLFEDTWFIHSQWNLLTYTLKRQIGNRITLTMNLKVWKSLMLHLKSQFLQSKNFSIRLAQVNIISLETNKYLTIVLCIGWVVFRRKQYKLRMLPLVIWQMTNSTFLIRHDLNLTFEN